jgi:uncharacterized repeat protein (TIGR03806 family)
VETPVVAEAIVGEAPLTLSEYHLFRGDAAAQRPNAGVLPYDLNTALFSDYAEKLRFVWMPPGTSARYDAEGPFDLPVGTALVKTFAYPRETGAGLRLLETRLLVRRDAGWEARPYVWDEAQTEATLNVAGAAIPMRLGHGGDMHEFTYLVPNANQCKGCHVVGDAIEPIGPRARHLNREYDYAGGRANQIERWREVGYLTGAPQDVTTQVPRLARFDDPESGDLEARARAWLEVNCAHCHAPGGPAATTGLDLRVAQTESYARGVCKPPVAAGHASGGRQYDIVPGAPDASILVYRIESVEPAVMMPELGRRLVHREGVALVREWIAGMAGACE